MLISFEVKNFMSFYKKTKFSMEASKGTRLREHVVPEKKYNLLKSAFIFGANASGKTNFIKAIDFLRKLVVDGFDSTKIDKKFYRINKNAMYEDGFFSVEFSSNGDIFKYEISFSYLSRVIKTEKLCLKKGTKSVVLFDRCVSDDKIKINTDYKFISQEDRFRFDVYVKDYAESENSGLNQVLFLRDVALRSSSNSQYFKCYINALKWFLSILIIFPNTKFGNIIKMIEAPEKSDAIKEALEKLDTGITGVAKKVVDYEKVFNSFKEEENKDFMDKLIKDLDKHPLMMKIENAVVTFEKNEDDSIIASKMQLEHGNSEDLFDYMDESDGTQRLFDLIPVFISSHSDRLIIIDEIDRSLHTKLTRKLVEIFFQNNTYNNSQLIVSSHDCNLMDLDLLRQDEIWFVNKGIEGESNLISLKEFKVRFDKKILKEYFEGVFGGVPKLE